MRIFATTETADDKDKKDTLIVDEMEIESTNGETSVFLYLKDLEGLTQGVKTFHLKGYARIIVKDN